MDTKFQKLGMDNKQIIDFKGQYDGLEKSLKVLDYLRTLDETMTVKEATDILEDSIRVLPQLTFLP